MDQETIPSAQPSIQPLAPETQVPPNNNRMLIIIGIFLILIVGFGGFYLGAKSQQGHLPTIFNTPTAKIVRKEVDPSVIPTISSQADVDLIAHLTAPMQWTKPVKAEHDYIQYDEKGQQIKELNLTGYEITTTAVDKSQNKFLPLTNPGSELYKYGWQQDSYGAGGTQGYFSAMHKDQNGKRQVLIYSEFTGRPIALFFSEPFTFSTNSPSAQQLKHYSRTNPDLALDYPITWQESSNGDRNIAFNGPEGGISIFWGGGFGGAPCTGRDYIFQTKAGTLDLCDITNNVSESLFVNPGGKQTFNKQFMGTNLEVQAHINIDNSNEATYQANRTTIINVLGSLE